MASVTVHGFQLQDAILHHTDLTLQVDPGAQSTNPVSPYGEMYVYNNSTAQTLPLINTYYVIAQGWTAGVANGMSVDLTTKTIVVNQAGLYTVSAIISFTGDNNETCQFAIHKNNTPQNNLTMGASCRGAGLNQDVSILGFLSMAANDTFDIRVKCTSNPAKDIVVTFANLGCRGVS